MPSREAFTQRQRRAIIRHFEQGLESPDIAPLFDASESGVRRVYQQYREEGRDKPAFENCGRNPGYTEDQKQQIIAIVKARPDLFLHELTDIVRTQLGIHTSRHSLGRWLTSWNVTRKKSPSTPRNNSATM